MSRMDSGLTVRVDSSAIGRRAVVCGAAHGDLDVTRPLVEAVAQALWHARGGDDLTNWRDAERVVDQLLTPAGRREAKRDGAKRADGRTARAVESTPRKRAGSRR